MDSPSDLHSLLLDTGYVIPAATAFLRTSSVDGRLFAAAASAASAAVVASDEVVLALLL